MNYKLAWHVFWKETNELCKGFLFLILFLICSYGMGRFFAWFSNDQGKLDCFMAHVGLFIVGAMILTILFIILGVILYFGGCVCDKFSTIKKEYHRLNLEEKNDSKNTDKI